MGEPLNATRAGGDEGRVDYSEPTNFSLPRSAVVSEKTKVDVYQGDLYVDGLQIRERDVPLSRDIRLLFTAEDRSVDRILFGVDSKGSVGIQRQVGKNVWVGPEVGLRTFTDIGGGLENQFFVGVRVSFKIE